jgi:hypothetical protein
MTMFIKIENGVPVGHAVTLENMQYLFPTFNFNQTLTSEMVAPLGYALYEFSQIPSPERYKKIQEGTPIARGISPEDTGIGVYYQNWLLVDMTDEERTHADSIRAEEMRQQRNLKLRLSDWTQLPDSPLTAEKRQEWVVYRSQLRDITNQAGFPWNVVWPTEPTNGE